MNVNNSGNYFLNTKSGELTACNGVTNPPDTLNAFLIDYNAAQHTFGWSVGSALVIEQVIVRGGPNTLVYNYLGTGRTGDSGLHGPVNPNNCRYYPVQTVEIVYRYQLSVVHTVRPVYTRTFNWNIAQSVTPASWAIFNGDRATARYTVSVNQAGFSDSGWGLNGTIEVRNNTPLPAQIVAITDTIRPGVIGISNINCGTTAFTLVPGGVLNCSFTAPLADVSPRTATLQVTTFGMVRGRTVATPFVFGTPTNPVNAAINVTDNNGQNRSNIQKDSTYTYDRLLTCSNQGNYVNTATIVETGQKAAATVSVQCFSPQVTTSVTPVFTRQWDWLLSAKFDQKNLVLSPGQYYRSSYQATAEAKMSDQYAVQGTVSIRNPHPTRSMNLPSVSASLTGGISAPVNCPVLSLAPGATLSCNFNAVVPDGSARTASVFVNQQNYTYPLTGNPTGSGGTRTTGTASVIFPLQPSVETDECAVVYRDSSGVLLPVDTLCRPQGPVTYDEKPYIGPYLAPGQCDTQAVYLAVGVKGLDSQKAALLTHPFQVIVPCEGGCTLSQTYWSNHGKNGIAVYDDNWLNVGDADGDGQKEGENENFYASGRTYWGVLNAPLSTNPYWTLARAFVAADLNMRNGSDPTAVQSSYNAAVALLQTYTPSQVPALPALIRKNFILVANVLDRYNNGILGPGRCSDDTDLLDQRPPGAEGRENPAAAEPAFTLAPNPASDRVLIQMASVDLEGLLTARIVDLRGTTLHEQTFDGAAGGTLLETAQLLTGMYVVQLRFPDGTTLFRKLHIVR
jgi:hypothetical protein